MAQLGFFIHHLIATDAVWTHVSLVELHHDPEPFEGRSSDWATTPRQVLKGITYQMMINFPIAIGQPWARNIEFPETGSGLTDIWYQMVKIMLQ